MNAEDNLTQAFHALYRAIRDSEYARRDFEADKTEEHAAALAESVELEAAMCAHYRRAVISMDHMTPPLIRFS